MRDHDCTRFLQTVLPRLGLRWAGFRKPRRQVCKRVVRRMGELGLRSTEAYLEHLERHPGEWRVLDRLCRVTISRFRRDRGLWRRLEEEVLPCLAERLAPAGGGRLLCWSAGCASGEEAYTLSILWTLLLAGEHPGVEPFVLATDIDPHLLARARRGVFPEGAMKELPEEWIDAAFDPVSGGAAAEDEGGRLLQLRDRFRRPVRLACADLREAMPKARFHLVLCRNLAFVYYEEELQRRIAADIARRVPSGGYLAIGGHETLPSGAEGWEDGVEGLYRRDASSPDLPSALPSARIR